MSGVAEGSYLPWLFLLLVVALAGVVGYTIAKAVVTVRRRKAEANLPIHRVQATVGEKQNQCSTKRTIGISSTDFAITESYTVAFLWENHEQVFSVDGNTYCNLHEGEQGILVFQGTRFLEFYPEDSHIAEQ